MALVTVVMSVFNEKFEFLSIAIESILNQTFQDFIFCIINDGTTESDTLNCLRHFSKQDKRVCIIHQANLGLTKSLNKGIKLSDSKYIVRQDSDDWSSPKRLEKQINYLEQNPVIGLVGSFVMLHQENGKPLWIDRYPETTKAIMASFPSRNPFCHGAVCFSKKVAASAGLYRERLQCAQDYDFFWRICEGCDCTNLNEALYHYRFTKNSISTKKVYEQAFARKIARVLALQRSEKLKTENFNLSWQQTEEEVKKKFEVPTLSYMIVGDRHMLAGAYFISFQMYLKAIKDRKHQITCLLKIVRLVIFILFPPIRKQLFNPYASC